LLVDPGLSVGLSYTSELGRRPKTVVRRWALSPTGGDPSKTVDTGYLRDDPRRIGVRHRPGLPGVTSPTGV
jgi:hypothetical protein